MKISILYYHKKTHFFLLRTVSALGLVLKARVFGSWKKLMGRGGGGGGGGEREAKISSLLTL